MDTEDDLDDRSMLADDLLDDDEAERLILSPDELPPEGLPEDVEIRVAEIAIDVNEDGVLDQLDELVAADGPMAIGEMACATASIADPDDGAAITISPEPACGIAFDGSTSPNTSYDPVGCPHQYITEVGGTFGRPLSFYWDWEGSTLNESNCALAHANISAYGAYLAWPWTVNWVKLGTSSVHGVWVDNGWFSQCSWEYDAGSGPLPSLDNHFYFKVRTATQATGFIFKQEVEGGVTHGPGPC